MRTLRHITVKEYTPAEVEPWFVVLKTPQRGEQISLTPGYSLSVSLCVFLYSSSCHSSYSSRLHLGLPLIQTALLQCTPWHFVIVLGKGNLLMMQVPRLLYPLGCLSEDIKYSAGTLLWDKARDGHVF